MGENSPDLEQLRREAAGGGVAALKAFGHEVHRQTGGEPFYAEAAEAFRQAAAQGDAEAHFCLSALASGGIGMPIDWDYAIERLAAAAAGGWDPARQQILALGPGSPDAQVVGDWTAEVRRIDLAAWTQPHPGAEFRQAPRILTFAGFLSPAVCRHVIDLVRDRLIRARNFDADQLETLVNDFRSNKLSWFSACEGGIFPNLLKYKIEQSLGARLAFESTAVLHYQVGEQFLPHFDFLDPTSPGGAAEIQRGGQRIATMLITLNDDFEGGETEFTAAGVALKGQVGSALCFSNVDAAGNPDPMSRHAGRPPTKGEKWIISQFIRAFPQG